MPGSRYRSIIAGVCLAAFSAGIICLNGLSLIFADADKLLLFYIVLLSALLFPIGFLIMESPVWMMKHKRYHEAADILNRIAAINKEASDEMQEEIAALEMQSAKDDLEEEKVSADGVGFMDSFRIVFNNPTFSKNLLILSSLSSALFCLFYGMAISLKDLGFESMQTDGVVMGITHGLGYSIIIPFLDKTPRKIALLFIQTALLAQAASLLFVGFLPHNRMTSLLQSAITSILVPSTLAALYSFSYLANTESFPPHIRGFCVGLILLVGKVVGSATPFICHQSKNLGIHLLVGCSFPMIVSLLFTLDFKETLLIKQDAKIKS